MSLLQVDRVGKAFAGLTALEDVSLSMDAGIVGLIGPNGAGKTTLFNVIAGRYIPDRGRIVFEGADITGLRSHDIARLGVARTFQLTKPFTRMSVLENVLVAAFARERRRAVAESAAREVIERVGLGRWMDDPAGELSTAGRKRLELARGLALRPSLLLLDEVLAGLTPREREPVVELLRELRTDFAMILVEHVMAAVMALCDKVVVLHHGRVLAAGAPQTVTRDPEVVEAYLGEEFLLAQA